MTIFISPFGQQPNTAQEDLKANALKVIQTPVQKEKKVVPAKKKKVTK